MTASTPIASVDGGKDSTLPQQPHSADGRLAQQAREVDADLDFVVEQAEATSANESIPTIATKATKATFVLERCLVMA